MYDDQREIIALQREMLSISLSERLQKMARRCRNVWREEGKLNRVLALWLDRIPYARLIYATDVAGIQISANVFQYTVHQHSFGQDLSGRPYLNAELSADGFLLSEVYISKVDRRPCITAIQAVSRGTERLGFIAVDFELRDLPLLQTTVMPLRCSQQISGDPAIRAQVLGQRRCNSEMDQRIHDVVAIIDDLICERGVFHAKLHFSSSRATLWLMDDPYHYRVHVLDEIIDPSICMAYRKRAYPTSAVARPRQVRSVLERFVRLRFANESLYLRSGSLNVMNARVGLTLSCDGCHYLSVDEFLERESVEWLHGPVERTTESRARLSTSSRHSRLNT